jgi:hypothetical protein
MAYGFLNLPKAKWLAALRQVILKTDFVDVETALLEAHGLINPPIVTWVDATSVKVSASADCPAAVLMSGVPNFLHTDAMVTGGLSDGKYRANVVDTVMDFDVASSLWGTEKLTQWYALLAIADDVDTTFTLKAMPWMRVCSQAGQVISLGTMLTPATGRRYGFVTDELLGGIVYVTSGVSRGLMRTISANNDASGSDGTSGTITYSGTALTLAAGDVFIVLPPGKNFRLIDNIFNNAAGNIVNTAAGAQLFDTAETTIWLATKPLAHIAMCGSGGGGGGGAIYPGEGWGAGGGKGEMKLRTVALTPGVVYTIIVGAGGSYANSPYGGGGGGPSSIADGGSTILSCAGGAGGAGGAGDVLAAGNFLIAGEVSPAQAYGNYGNGGRGGVPGGQSVSGLQGFVWLTW